MTTTPAAVPVPVKPSIAVLYANGNKQAVGLGQYFQARDLWFRLDAVEPKTIELSLVDGGFSGGRARDHRQPRPAGHAGEHRDRSRVHPALRGGDLRHRHDLAGGAHRRGARRRRPAPTKGDVNKMTFHMPRPRLLIHAALVVVGAAVVLRDRDRPPRSPTSCRRRPACRPSCTPLTCRARPRRAIKRADVLAHACVRMEPRARRRRATSSSSRRATTSAPTTRWSGPPTRRSPTAVGAARPAVDHGRARVALLARAGSRSRQPVAVEHAEGVRHALAPSVPTKLASPAAPASSAGAPWTARPATRCGS